MQMVIDTCGGRYIVSIRLLPEGLEQYLKAGSVIRANAANGQKLKTRSLIRVWLNIGSLITQYLFIVSDDLSVPVIIGTGYQDVNIKHIGPMNQDIVMRDGSALLTRQRISSREARLRIDPPMIGASFLRLATPLKKSSSHREESEFSTE